MVSFDTGSFEGDPKGGISRLAKMRKPECTVVHEDFRIKRNAEITLLGRPLALYKLISKKFRAGYCLSF